MTKTYLGDGVYVQYDGHGLVLTAENGISVTNKIYLEPEVYQRLKDWVNELALRARESGLDGQEDPGEVICRCKGRLPHGPGPDCEV